MTDESLSHVDYEARYTLEVLELQIIDKDDLSYLSGTDELFSKPRIRAAHRFLTTMAEREADPDVIRGYLFGVLSDMNDKSLAEIIAFTPINTPEDVHRINEAVNVVLLEIDISNSNALATAS